MEYSKAEKEAINYFLVKLMKADGHTEFMEAATLFEVSKQLNISLNQADNSLLLSEQSAKSTIKGMNAEKRLHVLSLLKRMANVDGHFDSVEKDFILKVFS